MGGTISMIIRKPEVVAREKFLLPLKDLQTELVAEIPDEIDLTGALVQPRCVAVLDAQPEEGAAGMLKLRRELDGLGYTFDQQENLNWYDYVKSNAPRSLIREARDVLGIQTRAAKVKP